MTTYNLTAGNTGIITVAYFTSTDGTGTPVPTPGQTTIVSSDPTVLEIDAPTGLNALPYKALKGGAVTITISVPAASDATHNYSAFTGTATVNVALTTVTIQSFTLNIVVN